MTKKDDLLAEIRAENLAKAHAARNPSFNAKNLHSETQEALSTLKGPRAQAVAQRAAEIPPRMLRAYLRAVCGKSLRSAVTAFCSECAGWNRAEVRRCTSLACPLYLYRPYQRKINQRPD